MLSGTGQGSGRVIGIAWDRAADPSGGIVHGEETELVRKCRLAGSNGECRRHQLAWRSWNDQCSLAGQPCCLIDELDKILSRAEKIRGYDLSGDPVFEYRDPTLDFRVTGG